MPCSAMFLFYFLVQKVQKDFKSSLKSHFLAFYFLYKITQKMERKQESVIVRLFEALVCFFGK